MTNEAEGVQARKRRVREWFKDPYTNILIVIVLFAILIRVYYFIQTSTQPLWWDESDYLAYAKTLAGFNTDWIVTPQHNSLFPLLVAALFSVGFSEAAAKLLLEIIPSILLVPLAYIVCMKMYNDKKIALSVAFLMATFWVVLFNSMRFHLGVPALLFGLLAAYVFWQGYEKKQNIFGKIPYRWAIPLTGLFVVLTYATRRGYFVFGFFFLVYMLLTRKPKELFTDKYNWIALGAAILLLIVVEQVVFISPISNVASTYFNEGVPFNLSPFDVFGSYFNNTGNQALSILFYLFWVGFLLVIGNVLMHSGYVRKTKGKVRGDLFTVIMILVTLSYFLFFQRDVSFGEPRWYFPLLLGSFICIARSANWISDYLSKCQKYAGIIVLAGLLLFGGYYQLQHADSIIENRAPSFSGIKSAGLFIQDHSTINDVVISVPEPQAAYYSERKVIGPAELIGKPGKETTVEEFIDKLKEDLKYRYIIVTFSEPGHPPWMQNTVYVQHPHTGQPTLGAWEIPFMDTRVDFLNNQQDILETKTFDDSIEIALLTVQQDAFVYEVRHIS